MKLYNALTRNVDPVKPLHAPQVTLYTCGPTVYDHSHIGNLSSYIFADTLRRALQLAGFNVKHVTNYTDVDDKTIRRSRERYPTLQPHAALHKLTNEFINVFLHDMQRIGNDVNTIQFMRATDNIEVMKDLIVRLHQQGFAYIADDGVYFSIDAYRKSGKTYGQLLTISASNTSEARIQNDEYDKESVHDFALWKAKKPDEPSWEFTLDGQDVSGRPGWHVECSAMSREGLGQPFDIHTGGVDLIFPHHENEIAQSTAGENNPVMAQCFAHNDHILVDGKKMSKSLQNFYTLEDIVCKGYDPLAFRLMVLQAHYRSQVNFTWESLTAAQSRLKNWQNIAALQWQATNHPANSSIAAHEQTVTALEGAIRMLPSTITDDLHTPEALRLIDEVFSKVEATLLSQTSRHTFIAFLQKIDQALGLTLSHVENITPEIQQLITEREQARKSKDWAKSDELRSQLAANGIGTRDTLSGTVWYRL